MTIRRHPEDFRVDEILDESLRAELRQSWEPGSPHAVYELTKTSTTTPDAAASLARVLRVPIGAVSYAGLKDKHARTTQHVSVTVTPGRRADDFPAEPRADRWSARRIGWAGRAVDAHAITGNRFSIVVRDLARETCREMDRRAEVLSGGAPGRPLARGTAPAEARGAAEPWFINYFGSQRFGSARHGEGFVAERLIHGDFEGALRLAVGTPARKDTGRTRVFTRLAASRWGEWEALARELPRCPERAPFEALASGSDLRRAFATLPAFLQAMYLEAFQSDLWNSAARLLAGEIAGGPARCLRSDDAHGEMLFPPGAVSEQGGWRELVLPLVGPNTLLEEPWGSKVREALARRGITIDQLRVPGLKRPFFGEAPRHLFARAAGFAMSEPAPDPEPGPSRRFARRLEFSLPRGSYATVVLRALGH